MTTSDTPAPAPLTLTARSPDDVLALVPVVLGFVPTDSVVMLTFDAQSPFHARVDLPGAADGPDGVADMVTSLLDPAVRHGVGRTFFVVYTDQPLPAERVARRLVRRFREAGIDVIDVLRADGQRWFPLLRSRRSVPSAGVPYDVSAHPFAARAVVEGMVTHESRAALAQQLEPDPEATARVVAALREHSVPGTTSVTGDVLRHVADRTVPDDHEAGRLLQAVAGPAGRHAAMLAMSRAEAKHHVELWTDLVRRAPEPLVGPAAGLLALAAWLSGHGALAWCAVDRAEAVTPGQQPAAMVADLLLHAVPPECWERAWSEAMHDVWEEVATLDDVP
jgi:hypothetical protein